MSRALRDESPQVICAKATGCEHAQDGDCPLSVRHTRGGVKRCPATGKPVEWRAS